MKPLKETVGENFIVFGLGDNFKKQNTMTNDMRDLICYLLEDDKFSDTITLTNDKVQICLIEQKVGKDFMKELIEKIDKWDFSLIRPSDASHYMLCIQRRIKADPIKHSTSDFNKNPVVIGTKPRTYILNKF